MSTSLNASHSGADSIDKISRKDFLTAWNCNSNPFLSCRQHGAEISLVMVPIPGEKIESLIQRLAQALQGTSILGMQVFGSTGSNAAFVDSIVKKIGKVNWPITWIDGASCGGSPIAGIQVAALVEGEVQRLFLSGRAVGSVFQDAFARHCLIGGIGANSADVSREEQTKQTLENVETVLETAGFAMSDIFRTWFFNENILEWYNEFNRVRSEHYSHIKFRTDSLPASTGVGARNPSRGAMTFGARAIQSKGVSTRVFEVASPLQCPAPAYGSSFSRAMEVSTEDYRQIYISGTASIAQGGATLWEGDIHRQIDLTMKVVKAILEGRGFSLTELTRAVAYFKHPQDIQAFREWCARNNHLTMPVVASHCDICRDDLLFELEADAAKTL